MYKKNARDADVIPTCTFYAHDAGVILRAPLRPGLGQLKDFHTHRFILSIASTLFRDVLSLPQSAAGDDTLPLVPVTDPAEVFEIFPRFIYPIELPAVTCIQLVDDFFPTCRKVHDEWCSRETQANPRVIQSFLTSWGTTRSGFTPLIVVQTLMRKQRWRFNIYSKSTPSGKSLKPMTT